MRIENTVKDIRNTSSTILYSRIKYNLYYTV